jgi:hypothetical protein
MVAIGAPNGFSPFKIVAGMWNFYSRVNPTLVTTEPYLNPPIGVKTKDLLTYIQLGFRLTPIATFTLPDQGKIGMLVPSPFGGFDDFWLWPASDAGLAQPWDIQRRSVGVDEVSCWVSNRTPQQALYQFFPLSGQLVKWDLSGSAVTVNVFYVVPTSIVKGPTEIWIGGTHTLAATNGTSDCIVYMRVDKSNTSAAIAIWDLPSTPSPRNMNAILFTHKANAKTQFTKAQVWLSSSTSPEMTILEPKMLFGSTTHPLKDSVCFTTGQEYSLPNGLFWDDPSYFSGVVQAADNARRIWVTSAGTAGANPTPGFLSANKGGVTIPIQFVLAQLPKPQGTPIKPAPMRAEKTQQILSDSAVVTSRQDQIPCSIDRYIWDATTGLSANYSGALLDINMQGVATSLAAGGGFEYTIIWHEPTKGRIGMLWNMPAPLPKTIFDNNAPQSTTEETAAAFKLEQNYPNPFNPSTTITYNLPTNSLVTLKVYNTLGQQVATLLDNETQLAGEQNVNFNALNLPSGVYFYRIQTQDLSGKGATRMMDVKKMILLK